MMNVIGSWIREKGRLHFTLIDPDKQSPEEAGKISKNVESWGSDAILVGGSTVGGKMVDDTCSAIKKEVKIPVILFPGSAKGVSRFADYILFMSCLNSTRRELLVGEQLAGAPLVRGLGIKPIPMGYLLVSMSGRPTTVEKVAKPDVITGTDIKKAVDYALTAQYLGMHCVYLEAGSGADRPVPVKMISAVKEELDIPLIVGGGIRTPDEARERAGAGADVIVTGTIVEKDRGIQKRIIEAVKG